MNRPLFACHGGTIVLPSPGSLLVSREDGGHLIVDPPRAVWERSELTPAELARWSALVAAAGRAMIDALPQLRGGCVNYWDAGNWALHDDADPPGPKEAHAHRSLHLHLLGRSRSATHPAWRWGEAPAFPRFAERRAWSAPFVPLTARECHAVVTIAILRLRGVYGFLHDECDPWRPGGDEDYPSPALP